jgi:hypothetical protein
MTVEARIVRFRLVSCGLVWFGVTILTGMSGFLCFVDRASLYNLVNKANLVHDFS